MDCSSYEVGYEFELTIDLDQNLSYEILSKLLELLVLQRPQAVLMCHFRARWLSRLANSLSFHLRDYTQVLVILGYSVYFLIDGANISIEKLKP